MGPCTQKKVSLQRIQIYFAGGSKFRSVAVSSCRPAPLCSQKTICLVRLTTCDRISPLSVRAFVSPSGLWLSVCWFAPPAFVCQCVCLSLLRLSISVFVCPSGLCLSVCSFAPPALVCQCVCLPLRPLFVSVSVCPPRFPSSWAFPN